MIVWDALIIGAFATAILCAGAILTGKALWRRFEARIQTMISEAIEHPTPNRYLDIDAEYRALVLEEHNRGDH